MDVSVGAAGLGASFAMELQPPGQEYARPRKWYCSISKYCDRLGVITSGPAVVHRGRTRCTLPLALGGGGKDDTGHGDTRSRLWQWLAGKGGGPTPVGQLGRPLKHGRRDPPRVSPFYGHGHRSAPVRVRYSMP